MPASVRKQFHIRPPDQEAILKRLAKKTGMTEAEIISLAIDHYTKMVHPTKREIGAWEGERTFITGLMRKGPLPGERTWKREDLHRR